MSDRSAAQIVIYDCPMEKRADLLALFEEFDFAEEFISEADELKLFTSYGYEESALDAYEEIARAVIVKVPEATFAAWNDPKYEYDGALVMYAPDLGRYEASCNSLGEPYILTRQVRDALTAGDLDKVLGLAWLDRFEELKEKVPV